MVISVASSRRRRLALDTLAWN